MHRSPWVVSVHDLINLPGTMRTVEFTVTDHDEIGVPLMGVRASTPVEINVRLESVHEGILASGTVTTDTDGECSRCLRPLHDAWQVDFSELFAYPHLEDYDAFVVDDTIDLEETVRSSIVLSLPFQPMCASDCAGLCPECGVRLADEPGHQHAAPIDARWSALADLATEVERSKADN